MKYVRLSSLLLLLFLSSCENQPSSGHIEAWQQEIIDVEKAFAEMVKRDGLHDAFVAFAADEAVLMRRQQLVKGKAAIDAFYQGNDVKTLSWAPEFVEVAASGDLAYTYGPFIFTSVDSLGNKTESNGIFHTVWKRQKDGNWKYVWD